MRLAFVPILSLAAWMAAGPAPAAERADWRSQVDDRFVIGVGAFVISSDTSVQLGSGTVLGVSLSAEDELGLDSPNSNVRMDGHWRFGRRRWLDYSVFSLNRSSRIVLDEELEIGDEIFKVDTVLDSKLDTGYLRVGYNYSMVKTSAIEFAFSAGLSFIDVEFDAAGAASVGGSVSEEVDGRADGSIFAPVPTVGQFVGVDLGSRVAYKMRFDLFAIRTGDIEGSLIDLRVGIDWFPFRYAGFGVGYNFVRIKFKQDKESESLDVDYRIDGPAAYFIYRF